MRYTPGCIRFQQPEEVLPGVRQHCCKEKRRCPQAAGKGRNIFYTTERDTEMSTGLIKAIHVYKNKLGIDDDTYRDMLQTGYGVSSSKDLTVEEATDLVTKLLGRINEIKYPNLRTKNKRESRYGTGKQKYENLNNSTKIDTGSKIVTVHTRGPVLASSKQLRYIEALWKTRSREKSDESLMKFCERITGKSDLVFISMADASALIAAIKKI